jgi:hypothetical protein
MLEALIGYDWEEVFGEGTGGNCSPILPDTCLDPSVSSVTFSREDVATIKGQSEGEKDERDWLVWGQLKDGRFFVARGWCDYTGWDCRGGNSGSVADTEEKLIVLGMDQNERERFGIQYNAPTAAQVDAASGK